MPNKENDAKYYKKVFERDKLDSLLEENENEEYCNENENYIKENSINGMYIDEEYMEIMKLINNKKVK